MERKERAYTAAACFGETMIRKYGYEGYNLDGRSGVWWTVELDGCGPIRFYVLNAAMGLCMKHDVTLEIGFHVDTESDRATTYFHFT